MEQQQQQQLHLSSKQTDSSSFHITSEIRIIMMDDKQKSMTHSIGDVRDLETWTLPNNAVATSDLEAAIQAIEATFQEALVGENETTRQYLLSDMQKSLVQHLTRIVKSVDDREFQDYVDLYHLVVPDDDADDDDDINDRGVDEEIELEQDEGQELDEADLLDMKSLQEARDKRAEVRALAQSIQETRDSVLKNSLEAVMKKEYTAAMEALENRPDVDVSAEMNESATQQQQASLNESLQALSKLLKDSQWDDLPKQLETLQNTIEVIQKESDRERPMSQTEAAIISRSNSADDEQDWEELLSQGEGGEALLPIDRLARFFELLE